MIRTDIVKAGHKIEDAAKRAASIQAPEGVEVCASLLGVWEDMRDLVKVLEMAICYPPAAVRKVLETEPDDDAMPEVKFLIFLMSI